MASRSSKKKTTSRSKPAAKKTRSKKKAAEPGVIAAAFATARERISYFIEDAQAWLGDAGVTRWAERAGWAAVVIAIIVGWTIGVPRLETQAAETANAEFVRVTLLDPPSWLSDSEVQQIETAAARDIQGNAFDRGELITVGRVVNASGWFESVSQVRRVGPGEIEVTARPLTPFAFVRQPGREDRLIDADGRVLPYSLPATRESGRREGLAAIIGVAAGIPPDIGAPWAGAEIGAALSLLRQIETRPWREQVSIIDASQFTRDGTLSFQTDAGSIFKWESPPGAERPLEPSAARKLEMLDAVHDRHPSSRIDEGSALTWWFFEDALTAERISG